MLTECQSDPNWLLVWTLPAEPVRHDWIYQEQSSSRHSFCGSLKPHMLLRHRQGRQNGEVPILQRRIIRIITFSDFRCHTSPLFYKLNILKLTDIYKLKLGILFHNIINNKFTGTNNLISLTSIHNHNTRLADTNNFYQTFSNSNLGLSSYTMAGLKFWRVIPSDLKSYSLTRFKFRLKQFLLNKYRD